MPEASHGRWEADFDGDERTMLTGFLDYHRATVAWKASDLTQAQMGQPIPSSSLTIAGIVKHLTLVEDSWFTHRFAGRPLGEPWDSVDWDADPDWEHHTAVADDPADLLTAYHVACDRSRAIVAAAESLEVLSVGADRHSGEPFKLRWILLHMIEETARHNGHIDLLREPIDGLTGE